MLGVSINGDVVQINMWAVAANGEHWEVPADIKYAVTIPQRLYCFY